MRLGSKLRLSIMLAISGLAVSVTAVSTLAWFQIRNSASPVQTTQTNNIQTDATVYQDNLHSNDDVYQEEPTKDKGGTLSYNHSKAGSGNNYYIRQYSAPSETVLQMYDNVNDTNDYAVYYNVKFVANWKIYNASTGDYYGYTSIPDGCSLKSSCSGDGYNNIDVTGLTGYYDVYFNNKCEIWLFNHSEKTTSDTMGHETGYYIYGTPYDLNSALNRHTTIDDGIPMYVNAAANTYDLAYYAGLRLSKGDTFYLVSGESNLAYKTSAGSNLLDNATYFSLNTTTGQITCNQVGYYCIALTSASAIHITQWDGYEADGTTPYENDQPAPSPMKNVDEIIEKQSVVKSKERKGRLYSESTSDYTLITIDNSSCNWGYRTLWLDNFGFSTGYTVDDLEYFIDENYGDEVDSWDASRDTVGWHRYNDGFNLSSGGTTTCNFYLPSWVSYCSIEIQSSWGLMDGHPHGNVNMNYLNNLYTNAGNNGTTAAHNGSTNGTGKHVTFSAHYWTNFANYDGNGNQYNNWCSIHFGTSTSNNSSKSWDTNTVYVKYVDSSGGSIKTGSSSSIIKYNVTQVPSPSPSIDGYTYSSVYYSRTNSFSSKTSTSLGAYLQVQSGLTIYLIYNAKRYSLSTTVSNGTASFFSDSGGNTSISKANYGTTIYYQVAGNPGYLDISLTSVVLNKDNFTFAAIGTADSNATLKNISCSKKTFTIKFDANGGTGTMSNMTGAKIGDSLSANAFSYSPRAFLGWSLSSGASSATYSDGKTITGEDADTLYANKNGSGIVTLYAVWGQVYSISINVAAASSGRGSVSPTSIANVPENTTITVGNGSNGYDLGQIRIGAPINTTIEATPTDTTYQYSYSFASWTGTAATVTSNMTISANFNETTNTYSLSGSGTNFSSVTFYSDRVGGTTTTSAQYGSTIYYSATGASGYKDKTGSLILNESNATLTIGTLSASINVGSAVGDDFTVTLDKNASTATAGTGSVTATYGSAMPTPITKPTRTGFTFAGYYDTSAASGGTKYYNADGSSAKTWNVASDTTLYARWTAHTYTITYNANGGSGSVPSDNSVTYHDTNTVTIRTKNTLERTGYTFNGWNTAADGSGISYAASATPKISDVYKDNKLSNGSTLTLFAQWLESSYDYYIYGNVNGETTWNSETSSSAHATASYSAATVTWEDQHFNAGDLWRIYRPSFPTGDHTKWDADNYTPNDYIGVKKSDYWESDGFDNFNVIYPGTYDITLTLATGAVSITLVSIDASVFTLYQYVSGVGSHSYNNINPDSVVGAVATWNNSVNTITLGAGYDWHIKGLNETDRWGINPGTDDDNIKATTNWTYYFTVGTDTAGTPKAVRNYYNLTATSITFDLEANTIVIEGIALSTNTFYLKTSSRTITSTSTVTDNVVTFSNVTLATHDPWRINVANATDANFNYSNIADNVTMLGQSTVKGTYFYNSSNYIGTGYGGTYTITFNTNTQTINITCSGLALTDFTAIMYRVNGKGQTSTTYTAMTSVSNDSTNHVATYSGTIHLHIGEKLVFANDNTASVHNYYFSGDLINYNNSSYVEATRAASDKMLYIYANDLIAKTDLTITYTFTFLATSEDTTKARFNITGITEDTSLYFNHAENAGIYVVTASDSSFTTGVVTTMMHTTSGKDSSDHTYLAQQTQISTPVGTSYLRVYRTHSNCYDGVGNEITEANLPRLTEYYYVVQDNPQYGFTSSTSTRNDYDNDFRTGNQYEDYQGNGPGSYVTVTVSGLWTVSLRDDGRIHIQPDEGAATISSEHQVPYYLVGRGMPGSDIRNCDYTVDNGEQMWTYGGNTNNVPCYVGKYETNNTDSTKYVGTGISLKAGDTFALSSASAIIKTFSSTLTADDFAGATAIGLSINTTTGVITVNVSGTYKIYLTGSAGSETINITRVSNDSASDWSRSSNIVAKNGIGLISSTGNTLTFGGNLDYSLLDAYGATGYIFEVQLDHISTGAAGKMSYTITNTSSYQIYVAKKDGNKASGASYSGDQSLNATNGTYTYTGDGIARSITASATTSTCLRITIPAKNIKSMIASGSYTFGMTISYTFEETTIS